MCPCAGNPPPHILGMNPELLERGYSGLGADDMAASTPPAWKAAVALGLVVLTLWATSRLIEPGGVRT